MLAAKAIKLPVILGKYESYIISRSVDSLIVRDASYDILLVLLDLNEGKKAAR